MKIAKKLLCTVLSLCMIAATIVLPVSVQAADGDVAFEYTMEDGTLDQTSGNYMVGAIADTQSTGATVGVVDGVGGNTGKVGRIERTSTTGSVQIRPKTVSTEIFADADTFTAEVELYVPALSVDNTAGMGMVVYTNATNDTNGLRGALEFDKWGLWTAAVYDKGTQQGDKYTNNVGSSVGGVWHKVAVTATKATDSSSADGTMKFYIDEKLVHTVTGLQIDTFYPDIRIMGQYRSDLTGGHLQYFDNYKAYEGEYQYAPYREKLIWYDFTDASEATGLTYSTTTATGTNVTTVVQADGFAGKDASDKVAHATGAGSTHRSLLNSGGAIANTTGVVTYEASVYVPSGSSTIMHLFNGGSPAWNDRFGIKIASTGAITIGNSNKDGSVWNDTDKVYGLNGSTTYGTIDNRTWNKLAFTLNSTTNTVKFYVNDVCVKTDEYTTDFTTSGTQFAFETPNCYIDNMRMYYDDYQETGEITDPSGVTDGVLTVVEGSTVADVKELVTDGKGEVYTSDVSTVSTTLADGDVLIVNKGELYKAYTIEVVSPYGTKIVWKDYSADADFTDGTNGKTDPTMANGFAGKAASDTVACHTDNHRPVFHTNLSGTSYEQVTYETKILVTAGSAATVTVWNWDDVNNERGTVKFADGKIYHRTAGDDYSYATTDSGYTYNNNTWYKVAIVRSADKWEFYVNGVKIGEVADAIKVARSYTCDFGLDGVSGTVYTDDYRIYTGDYRTMVDSAITAPAGAANGVINVAETATLEDVRGMVTEEGTTAKVYTSDLTTESTSLAEGDVLIINKGELYEAYTINIVSPYGTKQLWLTYTDSSDIYEGSNGKELGTQVAGFAGKAASDMVSYHTDIYRPNAYNSTWTSATGVMTYEAQIFVPDTTARHMHVYNGTGETTRTILKIENGVVSYKNGSDTTYSDVSVPVESNTWNKLVIVRDKTANTYTYYVNGVCLAEDVAATSSTASTTFAQDIGFEVAGAMYVDNYRVYTGDYRTMVDSPIAEISGAVDGVINVAETATLADVEAMVTEEGTTAKVYTSDLTTESTTLAEGDVLIINKGELYKSYTIHVMTKYEDAYMYVDFDDRAITNEGSGFGTLTSWLYANNRTETDDEGNTVSVSRKDEVTVSYVTGLGGRDSYVYKVDSPVVTTDGNRNVRFQTGYGNASTHITEAGVYTYEADVYRTTGAQTGASIMVTMRNATSSDKAQITLPSPGVMNRWYKLAITIDTVNKTIKGYINGVDATNALTYSGKDYSSDTYEPGTLVFNGIDYTVVSDQFNVNFSESKTAAVASATDNMRLYSGTYRGTTAPEVDEAVTMAANSTVADVLTETGADVVVDTNGNVVSSTAAVVETGYQAVTIDGEMFGYTAITVDADAEDAEFTLLKKGDVYTGKDGVDYVFMAIKTETVDASLYDMFVCTDGTTDADGKKIVKGISLSDMKFKDSPDAESTIDITTITGEVQIGILVMNIPAENADNFEAKLLLAD